MFKYENIKFGADPELFLRSKENGSFFPAVGLIGGTKENPLSIDDKGHAIQEDNVMVEFNIPPVTSAKELSHSVHLVLTHLEEKLPAFDLEIAASAVFSEDQLQSEQAKRFGCDPDFNAWTHRRNTPPQPDGLIRTAGGHIHIGYDNASEENQIELIKAMDLFVGVPSVILDSDKVRRSKYGKAGAFRPKSYGVEWRVASNFWIRSDGLMEWAFNNTHKAIKYLNDGKGFSKKLSTDIQNIINTGNSLDALELCRHFNLLERNY